MARNAIIDSLSDKIKRLIDENERLTKECGSLSANRDLLKEENKALRLDIASLEKRVKILELGGGLSAGTGDVKQARARINHLMREIDRCIELMNNK